MSERCPHERLDMEGYCQKCGVDMRSGIDLTPVAAESTPSTPTVEPWMNAASEEIRGLCIQQAGYLNAALTAEIIAKYAAAREAQARKYITVPELNHLAWVIVHNGLEPEKGFGGCSCDTCSLLRDCMKTIRDKEAQEYMRALSPAVAEEKK